MRETFLKLGINKAIGYTILSRLVQAGGGVFSVLFIARFLTETQQGYYYTFASILALQIFFELGLTSIITQYSAHEFANLHYEGKKLVGDEIHLSRLASLLRFCVKWFSLIAIFLFFALLITGYYFFNRFNHNDSIAWQFPWIILCFATSLNLIVDPIMAFFDGIGSITDMSRIRLMQKTLNVVLLFTFLISGFTLYSSALASLLAIILNIIQIVFSDKLQVLKEIWKAKSNWTINYSKEIFPYQWKIALSWISGYFIFYFFNPVLFATEGAIAAGQMGITLAALNGISSISMSWINTKIPLFSQLIARKEFVDLDVLLKKTVKQLALINFIGVTVFICFVLYIGKLYPSFENRFLPILPLVLLCVVTFTNQFTGSWATYLRCYKKEPFLILSIAVALLCALSTVILGNKFGMMGIVTGYTVIMSIFAFPWSYYIYKRKSLEFQR